MGMSVTFTHEISDERIKDLLCCALEGGSNYWYIILKFKEPSSPVAPDEYGNVYRHLDYPMSPDGGVYIIDDEVFTQKKSFLLDRAAIERGLQKFAEQAPAAMERFLSENEDADDGDVFLQLCVFGEVIYG